MMPTVMVGSMEGILSSSQRLGIWSRDRKGKDRLIGLTEKGIGAIYLGNAAAGLTYTDQENRDRVQSQKVWIFLRKGGRAGTVQRLIFWCERYF